MTPADRMIAFLVDQTVKRVDFDLLAQAADAGDSSLSTSPLRRRILAGAAAELAGSGVVRLPAARGRGWDRSAEPPLPFWVDRLTLRPTRAGRPGPRAWVEALAFAAHQPLSRADLELLSPINDHLRDHPDAEPVPVPERSYELYGDEKRLSRIASHRLVTAGFLSIADHLRAFPSPAPLAMYELGPAPWMLIVENSAAFTSLRRILKSWPRRQEVGWLAYGEGDHLIASLPTCLETFEERDHYAEDLMLYTDLDLDGLECAQQAAARACAAGLPPLVPAVGLFGPLLTQSPRAVPVSDAVRIRSAAAWLPEPLATNVCELLAQGKALRQEALPKPRLEHLLCPDQALLSQLREQQNRPGPEAPATA
ncbi:hypothetical protein [Streptomyces sp. NPDC004435]|uniref:hypothetical protein n=1 Tax=Streptomyces sp. NPDC004435 TaxID=3364701 RepID=UPI0036C4D7FF